MGTVHEMRKEETQDEELTARFRRWWGKQDRQTKQAIREIVSDDRKPGTKEDAVEVLRFLNLKTGKNYRDVPANTDMIRARLKTATVSQCKAVIIIKCREWGDDERFSRFLRPATLFAASKFEQYIGELPEEVS